ncbi:MAG: class I SAM-dependent methyltransferase [Lentimicrobiaceae bacterium]|nr:class I SAM-dependent methyltransferase [Lentimicrobiaceae bacterium]
MNAHLLFQILQLIIILIIFIFLIRYIWGSFFDTDYQPAAWKQAIQQKTVSPELRKIERQTPDKVRFFNFWFQIERIKRERIPGVFAELGVYRGETARIIHRMDPSRTLHLFDTFEGFPASDLKGETGEAATYSPERFSDTGLKKVKKRIDGNENIIFHPGYFPDTARGLEKLVFAFVSIDADLYQPIASGLAYFYPRLSPGGVIIVHDYNYKWEGAMRAVDEFMQKIPESLVHLPDMESSVMIVKMKDEKYPATCNL